MQHAKKILKHASIWIAYVVLAIVVYGYENNMQNTIYESIVSYTISSSVFYIHCCWLLPAFFEKKRSVVYFAAVVSLLLYNLGIRYMFAFRIDPFILNRPSSLHAFSATKIILLFSWQGLTYLLFSTGYWFARKVIRTEKLARERETLQLEVAALKAQINPHFLFNTLDFFRIKSRKVLPELADSMVSLVELIRYAITKPDTDGLISVEKEIEIIEKLIHIYRCRFPRIHLHYDKQAPEHCSLRIPQHILVSFVENAFKHGSYNDPQKKLRIALHIEETGLLLHTYNKKSNRRQDGSNGIGMKYIVRQLENNYPGNYSLRINDNPEDYSVYLKISS